MASLFDSLLIIFVIFLAFGPFAEIFVKLQAILTVEKAWISASRKASKVMWIEVSQLVFIFLKFLCFLSILIQNIALDIWKGARAANLKNIFRFKRWYPQLSRSKRQSFRKKRSKKFSWLQRLDQNIRNIFEENLNVSRRKIDNLTVLDTEIAKGRNGTIVLEGMHLGRRVAVKRLVKAHHKVAYKEIQNLIPSDSHPNIVRLYDVKYDKDYVYVVLEHFTCSLYDLIQTYSDSSLNKVHEKHKLRSDKVKGSIGDLHLWESNGHPSSQLLLLMRNVVCGLVHLHKLGIIHRDLKPQNVLILEDNPLCAKLSDFEISKRLLDDKSSLGYNATGCGSPGWQAPEQLLHRRESRAVDMFNLGCVLFFCITGGKHPFGNRREHSKMNLSLLKKFPEAEDLISRLLNNDPESRPQALEVLHHPLFWSSEKKSSFLRDTCERLKPEKRSSDIFKALKSIADGVKKWNQKMDCEFITQIHKHEHGRYKYNSVIDLLRAIRNNLSHYSQLPKNIQELLGSNPDGYYSYFASRFPKLLIEVYKVVSRFCKEEDCFKKYFKSDVA